MEDLDVYRAAKLLLDSKGDEAMTYARERIVDLTVEGDVPGRAAWMRIAAAIEVISLRVPSEQPVQ